MKRLSVVFFTLVLFLCSYGKANESDLPGHIDNSASPYFPPIANQGKIGACDWFAAVYYQMTFLYNQQYNRPANANNTFSPKFGYNILNNAGIYPYNIRLDDVYKFVQKHGAATVAQVPYDMAEGTGYLSWCTNSDIWKAALYYRIEGYEFFTYKNSAPDADKSFDNLKDYMNEIKRLLSQGEILVFQSNTDPAVCRYLPAANNTVTGGDDGLEGEYILVRGNNGPDHTMAMVGYDDHIWVDLNKDGLPQDNERGAFKIADSFGMNNVPNRNKGFFWISYSTVDASIFQFRINRMLIRNNYKPKICCLITLNTAVRDEIKFQFGRNSGKVDYDASQQLVFDPYGMGYNVCTAGVSLIKGGSFAYDGSYIPCDGSFVFDLSDIAQKGDTTTEFYLRIANSSDKPLIIKNFEITDMETGIKIIDEQLPITLVKDEIYRFLKL
jgi:hypothetical protein